MRAPVLPPLELESSGSFEESGGYDNYARPRTDDDDYQSSSGESGNNNSNSSYSSSSSSFDSRSSMSSSSSAATRSSTRSRSSSSSFEEEDSQERRGSGSSSYGSSSRRRSSSSSYSSTYDSETYDDEEGSEAVYEESVSTLHGDDELSSSAFSSRPEDSVMSSSATAASDVAAPQQTQQQDSNNNYYTTNMDDISSPTPEKAATTTSTSPLLDNSEEHQLEPSSVVMSSDRRDEEASVAATANSSDDDDSNSTSSFDSEPSSSSSSDSRSSNTNKDSRFQGSTFVESSNQMRQSDDDRGVSSPPSRFNNEQESEKNEGATPVVVADEEACSPTSPVVVLAASAIEPLEESFVSSVAATNANNDNDAESVSDGGGGSGGPSSSSSSSSSSSGLYDSQSSRSESSAVSPSISGRSLSSSGSSSGSSGSYSTSTSGSPDVPASVVTASISEAGFGAGGTSQGDVSSTSSVSTSVSGSSSSTTTSSGSYTGSSSGYSSSSSHDNDSYQHVPAVGVVAAAAPETIDPTNDERKAVPAAAVPLAHDDPEIEGALHEQALSDGSGENIPSESSEGESSESVSNASGEELPVQAMVGAATVGVAAAAVASDKQNEEPDVLHSETVPDSVRHVARGFQESPLPNPEIESEDDESSRGSSRSSTGSWSSASSSGSYDSKSRNHTGSSSSYSGSSSSSGSSYSSGDSSDASSYSPEPAMASESSFNPVLVGAVTKTPAPIADDASTPPPPPRHIPKGVESTMTEEGSTELANSLEQSGTLRKEHPLGRSLTGVPLRRAQSPTTTVSSLSASHVLGSRMTMDQQTPPSMLPRNEQPKKKRRRKRDKRRRRHEDLARFEINVNETLSALSKDESRLGVRTLVAMDAPKESVTTETLSMAPHTAHQLLHGFEALLAALLQVSDELELISTFQDGSSSAISSEALNAILSHAPALDSVFVSLRPMLQHYLVEEQTSPEMDALLSRAYKLIRLLCETTYRVCQRQEWSPRPETVFVTLIELLERLTVEITCLYDGQPAPDYKMTGKLRRAWSATGHMEEIKTVYVTSDSWLFQQVCYEVIVSTDQWCPDTKVLGEACEVKQSSAEDVAGLPSPEARLASVPQGALQVLDKINGEPLPRTATLASILRRILPPHAMTDTAVLNTFSGLRSAVRKPQGFSGASNMVAISSVPEVLNDPEAYGMRGVGKTTMAAMVAAHPDSRRFFKDGIAYINVGPKELTYARYTQCLRELVVQLEFYDGVPLFAELLHTPGEPMSRRKRREMGFMIYARDTVTELLQNRNVLILLDDVYFESDLEWFTFSFAVPAAVRTGSSKKSREGHCTLLVTTRTRDLLPVSDTVELDLLEEDDAIRLLVNESGLSSDYAIAESKEALAVVRECANHPLAVKTVGRWLGLKHASAGVINSVEEIHEDVAQSIDRILKSGDIQGADMMYEIMSMSFSPAVNGEPTNVIKLCFAGFVTVFCNEEYYSDFLPSVYPPMIPVSTADVLFEALLELDEHTLFEEGSLFYTQRREATTLIPEALSKLGVLKVITTYNDDTSEDTSQGTSRYSLEDSRFLQIMHFIQYEYGEYLSNEEPGMRALTQDAERRWNKAFATAYLKLAADWDSELPDASRDYAIEMIVSHMLRAEMYEEAANILADDTFVRGRVYTLGRQNATRRHIADCETLFTLLSDQRSKSELNPRSAMKRAYEALGAQLYPKESEHDIEERRIFSIEAGRAHYEIGFSLAERRCWHAALAHWESSQELLLSSLGMVEFVAAIQYNVGVVFAEMNEYEQGLASLKQCLRIRGAIHGEEHILYAQTIQKIGDVFLGMSDYAEAMDSYNWALDVMHVEPNHHRVDIGDILDNMGNIHYSMGEVSEALRCYEDALRSKKVELGDDHHELASTYQHLGNCLSDQGETDEAIEHFQEAIRLRELDTENDAERDADVLSIEGVLHNLTGRQEEGLHFYEKALEILAMKAPHRKEKIAALLHLIGCVYLMNGEHKKAMKLFQESLQTRRKVLGFVHLDVASTLFNIAFLHQTRNRLEKALQCLEEALKIRQLRLPDSEKVALTHEKIGTLCKALGKSSKAEDAFEEALRIRRQIHGESHESVATILHELGDLMDDLGEYEDAMRYYVDALDIRRKQLGPDHEDVAATLYSMGFTLHHQTSSERALQCFEESLNIRRRQLGEDSKEVGDTLNTMGYLQAKRGALDESLNLLWGALRIRKLHEDHVKVSETLKNIGNVHREKQEYELAVECYEECLRIRRTELGDNHEKVADALIAIANIRSDMENTEDAMRAYDEALHIRTEIYGKNDERVAVVLQYMGTMEFRSGDLDTAKQLLNEFISIRRENQLPHDGDYVNVLFMIGNIHKMQGDDQEARTCWEEAYGVFQDLGLAEENPQIAKVMNNLLYGEQRQAASSTVPEEEETKRPGMLTSLSSRLKDALRDEKMPKYGSKKS